MTEPTPTAAPTETQLEPERFAKYPSLPVLRCAGWEATQGADPPSDETP